MNIKELRESLKRSYSKGYEIIIVSRHPGTLEYFKEFKTVTQYANSILEPHIHYVIVCSLPFRIITTMPYNVRHVFIVEFDIRGREIEEAELEQNSFVFHVERVVENPEICRPGYESDFYFPTSPMP